MDDWFIPALMALIIYGFWGFFPKLAVNYINPQSAVVYEVGGAMLVGGLVLVIMGFQPEYHPKGVAFAALTGVAGMLGTLCFFAAASRGKISVVVSMTAMYPLITIILAVLFLKEPITLKQLSGMACSLLAIFLLSG